MGTTYSNRFNEADKFYDQQIQILASYFKTARENVSKAGKEDDCRRATDVLFGQTRIGLRVRFADVKKYGDQFTLRTEKTAGESELTKVKAGWGDYLLYCFGDQATGKLTQWKLIDLSQFRRSQNSQHGWLEELPEGLAGEDVKIPGRESFKAWKLIDLQTAGFTVVKAFG